MPQRAAVPSGIGDLTPDFLTGVLQSHGCLPPDGRVANVGAEKLNAGLAANNVRVAVEYSGDEGTAPSSFIAKLPSEHGPTRALLASVGGYLRESYFYSRVAGSRGESAGIRVPECYHAEFDPQTQALTILLEDLAPATTGDHVIGFTYEQSAEAVRAAASMHARWWQSDGLERRSLLRKPGRAAIEVVAGRSAAGLLPALERFGPSLSSTTREILRRLDLRAAFEFAFSEPRTLTHGDFHAENIFLDAPGGPVVIDWQLVQSGLGIVDVVRLAMYSLRDPSSIDALLALYVDLLDANGIHYADRAARDFALVALYQAGVTFGSMGDLDTDSEEAERIFPILIERVDRVLGGLDPQYLTGPLLARS